MAKYYKFHYDTGCCGIDIDKVFKYDDCASEEKVEEDFDEWAEEQRTDKRHYRMISEEEAIELGIDEDLSKSEE